MTNFILENYIPKQDIKVIPTALVKEIYKLFDTEIEDISFKDKTSEIRLKYINYLYKKIKKLLVNYHFWNRISSYNFCCYQYSYTKNGKDEDIGKICGRRINIKNSYDNNSNKYLCSEHDRNHRKYHSRPIKINENPCNHINKDGSNCKYKSILNGLCTKHHKFVYKINKEEIYNKIIFYKEYTNIELEINILNNIVNNNLEKPEIIHNKNKNDRKGLSIELLEIDSPNLNNSNTSRDKLEIPYNFNKNSNKIIDISKNVKNIYDKTNILNNKIINTNNILDNIKNIYKNYTNIESRKCEYKCCTNNKQYNIIYSTYCTEHLINREKSKVPNFFHTHTTTPPLHNIIESSDHSDPIVKLNF